MGISGLVWFGFVLFGSVLCCCVVFGGDERGKDTHPLMINNLNNSSQLPLMHAAVDEDHAAELDLAPDGGDDFGVAHGGVAASRSRILFKK